MDSSSMYSGLFKQLQELHGAEIRVGVQAEAGENFHGENVSSDSEMLKIAWVHEYGCDIEVTPKMRAWLHHNGIHLKKDTKYIHIPERSYIRRGYEEGKADFARAMSDLIEKLFKNEITVDELLNLLGRQAVTDTLGSMGVNTTPISSFAQSNRKASMTGKPLTDTGALANHITAVIKKGGSR